MGTNSFSTNFLQRLQGLGLVPQAVEPVREQANQYLSPYGLSMPTADQINPNVFFPNTGFFGNHERITNALEGALMGAAFTKPANTPGEGIANVAQGLLASRDYKQQNILKQYMAPFAMAGQLATLQQAQDQHKLAEDQGSYYKSHAALYESMPEQRRNATIEKLLGAWKPTGAGWEPNIAVGLKALKNPDTLTEEDIKNAWTFNPEAAKREAKAGRTMVERMVDDEEEEDKRLGGTPWSVAKRNNRINSLITQQAGGKVAAGTEAGLGVKEAHGDIPEDLRQTLDNTYRDYASRRFDPESKNTRSIERRSIMSDPAWQNEFNMDKIEAEITRRINEKNTGIDAERDSKLQTIRNGYFQNRRRGAVSPKAPRQVASNTPPSPRPGAIETKINLDGTVSVIKH